MNKNPQSCISAFSNSKTETSPSPEVNHGLRLIPGTKPEPLPVAIIPKLVSSKNTKVAKTTTVRKAKTAVEQDEPLTMDELRHFWNVWLERCRDQGHSEKTLRFRYDQLTRLEWFMENVSYDERSGVWDIAALRKFIAYVRNGHKEPGGRWGNKRLTKATRPLTIHRFWRELKAFYSFLVREEYLSASLVDKVEEPDKKTEQIPYLSDEHIRAMFEAALKSKYPRRDTAILAVLVDTGMRASELVNLRHGDVDLFSGDAKVLRKGGRNQILPLEAETAALIRAYIRHELGDPKEVAPSVPLFLGERSTGRPMTTAALLFLIKRLAKVAGINTQIVKISPHVFRHTCAVKTLMEGASERMIQELLGHTTLAMTHKYMALTQSDLKKQHGRFSPMAAMRRDNVLAPTLVGRPRKKSRA